MAVQTPLTSVPLQGWPKFNVMSWGGCEGSLIALTNATHLDYRLHLMKNPYVEVEDAGAAAEVELFGALVEVC